MSYWTSKITAKWVNTKVSPNDLHQQLNALGDFVKKKNIPKTNAVIFTGDFNADINSETIRHICGTLSTSIPKIISSREGSLVSYNTIGSTKNKLSLFF